MLPSGTRAPLRHGVSLPAANDKARDVARKNFLALIFCLMVGTAALPHILMRYYTTPSVKGSEKLGVLVAVLYLPALLHGARAGGAGEVRYLHDAGGR